MEQSEYFKQYKVLRPYLYKFAMSLTHNRDQAEDLVQETLIRGWRFLDKFVYGNLCSWLICIEKRIFLNDFYKSQRISKHCRFLSYEDLVERNSYFLNLKYQSRSNKISDDILTAIEKLPKRLKPVFEMARLIGYEQEEISKILEIPTGTVKSRLFRADKIMKEKLRDYVEN